MHIDIHQAQQRRDQDPSVTYASTALRHHARNGSLYSQFAWQKNLNVRLTLTQNMYNDCFIGVSFQASYDGNEFRTDASIGSHKIGVQRSCPAIFSAPFQSWLSLLISTRSFLEKRNSLCRRSRPSNKTIKSEPKIIRPTVFYGWISTFVCALCPFWDQQPQGLSKGHQSSKKLINDLSPSCFPLQTQNDC